MTPSPRVLLLLAFAAVLTGCSKTKGGSTDQPPLARMPADETLREIPLGAPPGEATSLAAAIRNPFEGDAAAIQAGKGLFSTMNCVYCHGAEASGLMGPSLNDVGWRYGGTPAELYNSIHDGRPKGMPAWGARLPPQQIWQIVAYLESLGGARPPAQPSMTSLGGAEPSTTGPEPAGEQQADTAHQAQVGVERRRRR